MKCAASSHRLLCCVLLHLPLFWFKITVSEDVWQKDWQNRIQSFCVCQAAAHLYTGGLKWSQFSRLVYWVKDVFNSKCMSVTLTSVTPVPFCLHGFIFLFHWSGKVNNVNGAQSSLLFGIEVHWRYVSFLESSLGTYSKEWFCMHICYNIDIVHCVWNCCWLIPGSDPCPHIVEAQGHQSAYSSCCLST
jgi:hypothetical protein